MRPEEWEAWTLVMSYAKENVSDFESAPFYVDAPRDEANADSGNYRYLQHILLNFREGGCEWFCRNQLFNTSL